MMTGTLSVTFRYRVLNRRDTVAVSAAGDHVFLSPDELTALTEDPTCLPYRRLAELKSKYFVVDTAATGVQRLLASRITTRRETVLSGPGLHIIVPTLHCTHSCRYCQVSRSLESEGFTMSRENLELACETIFESPSSTLTIEFQGGEPLLCFDLVRYAIERIRAINRTEQRALRLVVASTLHSLSAEMCAFFKDNEVYLSTSIDGPAAVHNRNRPIPTRDSYARTVAGIEMARSLIGPDSVSALMTTTRESLECPEAIVDTYVALGFNEIFLRPISDYGFARRNRDGLGYAAGEFHVFYTRAFERVLYWNRNGVPLREVRAAIALNKILSSFDAGYVDLQSPTGAGLAAVLYNYDGGVYPGDEARMLAAAGDPALQLGRIGEPLAEMLGSSMQRQLIASSLDNRDCANCAYNAYCGPDPVSAYNQWSNMSVPAHHTEHCQHQMALFDFLFERLATADDEFNELAHRWAQPMPTSMGQGNA